MQKTRALGSLKSLFPPIHQPLPLDKRESQRLLDAIKTSFRAQLDHEHAWVAPSLSKPVLATKPSLTYLPSTTTPSSAAAAEQNPARPTDRHMHAILRNPLFSPAQAAEPAGGFTNALDRHKAIFKKAVSRGLMNLNRAHGFLMQANAGEMQSKAISRLEGLTPTGAGRLVAQWLRSSGQERDLAFLGNQAFTRLLVRSMVADGLDDAVWTWFERLIKPGSEQAVQDGAVARLIISSLVYCKSLGPELDQAYATMLKAETFLKEKQLPPAVLRMAFSALAFQSTVQTIIRRQPPVDLFDPFVALGEVVGKPVEVVHLDLYHPLNPSADRAVKYLSDGSTYITKSGSTVSGKPHIAARLRWLGLDTVQHLMKANETREASRIWDLLQMHLGGFSAGVQTGFRYQVG